MGDPMAEAVRAGREALESRLAAALSEVARLEDENRELQAGVATTLTAATEFAIQRDRRQAEVARLREQVEDWSGKLRGMVAHAEGLDDLEALKLGAVAEAMLARYATPPPEPTVTRPPIPERGERNDG